MAKSRTRSEVRSQHRLEAKVKVLVGYANVMILDLTAKGCKISTSGMELSVGQKLVLRPGRMSGISSKVRWVVQPFAGIEFDNALKIEVLGALKSEYADASKGLSIEV